MIILSVVAIDHGTWKKQDITTTGASTLPSDEVSRMVSEAQEFSEEYKEKRDAINTKNQADSVVYQTEKQLKELGDTVRDPVKENVELKLGELKDAISGRFTQAIKDAMTAPTVGAEALLPNLDNSKQLDVRKDSDSKTPNSSEIHVEQMIFPMNQKPSSHAKTKGRKSSSDSSDAALSKPSKKLKEGNSILGPCQTATTDTQRNVEHGENFRMKEIISDQQQQQQSIHDSTIEKIEKSGNIKSSSEKRKRGGPKPLAPQATSSAYNGDVDGVREDGELHPTVGAEAALPNLDNSKQLAALMMYKKKNSTSNSANIVQNVKKTGSEEGSYGEKHLRGGVDVTGESFPSELSSFQTSASSSSYYSKDDVRGGASDAQSIENK